MGSRRRERPRRRSPGDRLRQRRGRPLDRPNARQCRGDGRDAVAFIDLLGLSEVDLLGFSLGGCVAQQIAAEHGRLVRKLILVGTAPKGGEEHLLAVLQEAFSQTEAPDPRLPLFFTKSSASQSAGLAFLKRAKVRKDDRDTDNGSAVTDPQAKALITWCATPDPEHAMLRAIRQPTLVVSGSHDTMLPADNAYAMFKALSNAQLILYPDSGHGALFQHHEMFVSHVRTFLDAQRAHDRRVPTRSELRCGGQNDNRKSRGRTFQPHELQTIRRCRGRAQVGGRATRHGRILQGDEGGKFLRGSGAHCATSGLGRTGLMLFAEFDLGAILRRETGSETPKIMRFVVGNPLIMKEMVKHVPDAGSYAPVTILVDERPDGVHVSYDKMESYLLPYGNPDALAVARNLDAKITTLLRECAS